MQAAIQQEAVLIFRCAVFPEGHGRIFFLYELK